MDQHDSKLPERPTIDRPVSKSVSPSNKVTGMGKTIRVSSGYEAKVVEAGPEPTPDLSEQFKLNARKYIATSICKKAASIEYYADPSLYVRLFGPDLQWALDLLGSSGESEGAEYVWCTVNPEYKDLGFKPDEQVARIIIHFRKLIKLTWVRKWWLCIEQRNKLPDAPDGIHAHFIIERGNWPPSKCLRDVTRHFLPICGSPAHIKVTKLKANMFKQKYRYMCGQKSDPNKLPLTELDAVMRKDLGVPAIMSDENPSIVDEDYELPQENEPDDEEEEKSNDEQIDDEEGSEQSWNGDLREDDS